MPVEAESLLFKKEDSKYTERRSTLLGIGNLALQVFLQEKKKVTD